MNITVKENKIIELEKRDGINIYGNETDNKVKIKIVVEKGHNFKDPLYMCFGITKTGIKQMVDIEITLEDESHITIISQCSFSKNSKHISNTKLTVGKNAKLVYKEKHYNKNNNIFVKTTTNGNIKDNGVYKYEFTQTEGIIGNLEINTNINIGENGTSDITTKTYATKNDVIKINENVNLIGKNGRVIIKSRGAARGTSKIKLDIKIEGIGQNTRGHIDCTEIIDGDAEVESIPRIIVKNKSSRITHEAAIGSVNKKQLETLMAKGLSKEESINMIIRGIIN